MFNKPFVHVLPRLAGIILLFAACGCHITGLLPGTRAESLNREAAAPDSMSGKIVETLGISRGMIIADIGSGGGFFTYLFAQKTGPEGKVYAVDVDRDALALIGKTATGMGLANITTIQAQESDSRLGMDQVDLVFMRNVYHELPDQLNYFRTLLPALKENGRIAIIEYKDPGGISHVSLFGHYTPEERILETMHNAGYVRIQRYDFPPRQSFNIFRPAKRDSR